MSTKWSSNELMYVVIHQKHNLNAKIWFTDNTEYKLSSCLLMYINVYVYFGFFM